MSFRRLELPGVVEGGRDEGAAGPSDFFVDQKPTKRSAEADKMRDEGW